MQPSAVPSAKTQSACQNCRAAHLSCHAARPCWRCVATGKESTCVDIPHKKRGRPRLRDSRNSRDDTAQQQQHHQVLYPAPPASRLSYASFNSATGGGGVGGGGGVAPGAAASGARQPAVSRVPQMDASALYAATSTVGAALPAVSSCGQPIAFLELEQGIVINANEDFKRCLGYEYSLQGSSITRCVASREWTAVSRLLARLRASRDRQRLMTAETASGYSHLTMAAIDSLPSRSIAYVTDFGPQPMLFQCADGRLTQQQVYFRLAFYHVYFAALWLVGSPEQVATPSARSCAQPMWYAAGHRVEDDATTAASIPRSMLQPGAFYANHPMMVPVTHPTPDEQDAYNYKLSDGPAPQYGAHYMRHC